MDRIARDFGEEKQRNRDLIDTVGDKEERIIMLEKQVNGMELRLRDKTFESEELRKNMIQSNSKLQQELDFKHGELVKLGSLLDDFKVENSEKKDIINTLEDSLNAELQEKRKLEFEIRNLNGNLDMANKKYQDATLVIQDLEKQ